MLLSWNIWFALRAVYLEDTSLLTTVPSRCLRVCFPQKSGFSFKYSYSLYHFEDICMKVVSLSCVFWLTLTSDSITCLSYVSVHILYFLKRFHFVIYTGLIACINRYSFRCQSSEEEFSAPIMSLYCCRRWNVEFDTVQKLT